MSKLSEMKELLESLNSSIKQKEEALAEYNKKRHDEISSDRQKAAIINEKIELVLEIEAEILDSVKEALDTLYIAGEGENGRATDSDFLEAYKKAGVPCELIQHEDDEEIKESLTEAESG